MGAGVDAISALYGLHPASAIAPAVATKTRRIIPSSRFIVNVLNNGLQSATPIASCDGKKGVILAGRCPAAKARPATRAQPI